VQFRHIVLGDEVQQQWGDKGEELTDGAKRIWRGLGSLQPRKGVEDQTKKAKQKIQQAM